MVFKPATFRGFRNGADKHPIFNHPQAIPDVNFVKGSKPMHLGVLSCFTEFISDYT